MEVQIFLFVAALERGIGALADARAWATTDALGGGKFPDFRPRENEIWNFCSAL